jgi:hypothetical protein
MGHGKLQPRLEACVALVKRRFGQENDRDQCNARSPIIVKVGRADINYRAQNKSINVRNVRQVKSVIAL